jgi:putative ABC transport system permease protein
MLRNYFTIAWRSLSKNQLYVLINIFGLAIGIAAVLLLFRMVQYEWSYDTYHPNADRIIRICTEDVNPDSGTDYTSGIPIPAMDMLQQSIPQFQHFARVHFSGSPTFIIPDTPEGSLGKKIARKEEAEATAFVEPAYFSIFQTRWLVGDPVSALTAPNNVAISQEMAETCFGSWQAAEGQTILMDNVLRLTVRGVFSNPPDNTDLPVTVAIAYETVKQHADLYDYNADWGNTSSNDNAFALLHHAGQADEVNRSLALVGQEVYQKNGRPGTKRRHYLQPLADMHFDARLQAPVTKSSLNLLSIIGVLILVMACFNFINLATAQAVSRSREVGVRKALGSQRSQLVTQFMTETVLIVLLAVGLGFGLAWVLLPQLKHVSNVPDNWPFVTNMAVWVFLGLTTLTVSCLAGFYPALVLSGFEPIRALKNNISTRMVGGVSLRKALVVLQFVIAQGLIIGTLVTMSQMDYLRRIDLGFTPDLVYHIQNLSNDSLGITRQNAFKQALQQLPGVESVSWSSDVPASDNVWSSNFSVGAGQPDAPFNTSMKFVDADYFATYQLRMVAGRTLQPSDTMREAVVNETLLRRLGITPEAAIGQLFVLGQRRRMPIVGVVQDFHTNSARAAIQPLVIFSRRRYYGDIGIKMSGTQVGVLPNQIKTLFDQHYPEQVMDARFFDESIARFYEREDQLSALCRGFALIAILISCLGLYGLASLLAAQKKKEIGVRKVLGASMANIVGLLNRDFLLLVLLAFVLAAPLAWVLMNNWLQGFVFRTSLSAGVFFGTMLLSVLVAFFTVSVQAIRAALINPVKSLRSE